MLISTSSFSEIYKWTDKDGNLHFSDQKIEALNPEVISVDTPKSNWSRFNIKINAVDVILSKEEVSAIEKGVNYVYEFFDKVLFFDIHTTIPVNVMILKDKSEYKKHLISKNMNHLIQSYGVYLGKENQIIVYIQKDRQRTFDTIKHEVSHAIVDTLIPYTPSWLNEGLAEQMETILKYDGKLHINPHEQNKRRVSIVHKNSRLLNIKQLLKLPSKEWRHTLATENRQIQAQSGQFVLFLLSKPNGRIFLTGLIHHFDRGSRTISYHLVDKYYFGGLNILDSKWEQWLKIQNIKPIAL